MTGKLIISLDFELMWGVRDHRTVKNYGEAVLGTRKTIPIILKKFAQHNIRATWATVGLLFAKNRSQMLEYAPQIKPDYTDPSLSPYPSIKKDIGNNEKEDPLHYGSSLIDLISQYEGQEIATHTYSHYYCLESGQTLETFQSDIESALLIAKHSNYQINSIVFPRNQFSQKHVSICGQLGIKNFRGNYGGALYASRNKRENTYIIRGLRYLDGIIPISGTHIYSQDVSEKKLINVPASRFLRPWNKELPLYSKLYVRNIKKEMEVAAKKEKIFHLWWHPHNMGRNIECNLLQLDDILSHFKSLNVNYGMQSINMSYFSNHNN